MGSRPPRLGPDCAARRLLRPSGGICRAGGSRRTESRSARADEPASSAARSRGRPSERASRSSRRSSTRSSTRSPAKPGGLPLLSTALLDLWREREGRSLTLESYERTGGVRGAIGRHAEAAFRSLASDEQQIARRMVLRLVAGGDREALTRRRVTRGELDADGGRRVDRSSRLSSSGDCSSSTTGRSSSCTKRYSSSGRGSSIGWRRTLRGAACTGT